MDLSATSLADQIPYYLTHEDKVGLVAALKNWPNRIEYYIRRWPNEVLQGDAWTKLPVRKFETGELGHIDGIVLSNSCSVDPANRRDVPLKTTVAPLVDLGAYIEALKRAGVKTDQLEGKLAMIKEQRVHNIFYLPAGGGIKTDQIALLDDLYSFPSSFLDPKTESKNEKLVTLSMVGFYLFVFKLSVHFCRLHENVERKDEIVAEAAIKRAT